MFPLQILLTSIKFHLFANVTWQMLTFPSGGGQGTPPVKWVSQVHSGVLAFARLTNSATIVVVRAMIFILFVLSVFWEFWCLGSGVWIKVLEYSPVIFLLCRTSRSTLKEYTEKYTLDQVKFSGTHL